MKIKRILLALLGLLVLLPVIGISAEYAFQAYDDQHYPPPGRMIDIGTHKMHIYCEGESHPGPVVVLDSGFGMMSLNWFPFIHKVADFAHVCVYDRAGNGWSEPGPLPRTIKRLADEEKATLDGAGLKGPFVLVPHSIAGFTARRFAKDYPDITAGIVFIDVSNEDQWRRFGRPGLLGNLERYKRIAFFGRFGYLRFPGRKSPLLSVYDPEWHDAVNSRDVRHQHVRALVAEMESWPVGGKGMEDTRDLGDLPIVVLSSSQKGQQFEGEERQKRIDIWLDMQREIASFSTDSRQITTDQSGHFIHRDQPELVIAAIHEILDRSRPHDAKASD